MSKAEEIHYKAVIAADNQEPPKDYCISAHADHFNSFVEGYVEGYHQAEKDLTLTWEDIREICTQSVLVEFELGRNITDERHYTEVLNRFNKQKEDGKVQNRT